MKHLATVVVVRDGAYLDDSHEYVTHHIVDGCGPQRPELRNDTCSDALSSTYRDGHDVMDVMLTLASNRRLADSVMPDKERTRAEFSDVGKPYTKPEQASVIPVLGPPKK